MKKTLLLLFSCFCLINTFSQTSLEQRAAKFYEEKNYAEALSAYDSIMKTGESAYLYYNYANTQFKLGHIGKAILYYERALLRAPYDSDIKASLQFANSQKTDKIDSHSNFFVVKWFDSFSKMLNTNQWAVLSICLFTITIVLLMLFLFSNTIVIRKITFFLGLLFLIISIIAFSYAFLQKKMLIKNPYYIVMTGSMPVNSEPTVAGKELFVLHEGTKVKVLQTKDSYSKIEISDGREGWAKSGDLEGI